MKRASVTDKNEYSAVDTCDMDKNSFISDETCELSKKTYKASKSGGALIYVFIIVVVLSLLTTTILSILNSNVLQSQYQQDSMEAYYLAYSGVQMAYSALLANSSAKLNELTRTTNPVAEQRQTDLILGNGKVTIVAAITSDTGYDGWIRITSVATLTRNNRQFTRTAYFDPTNPIDMIWKSN